jgi:hypothetical protein
VDFHGRKLEGKKEMKEAKTDEVGNKDDFPTGGMSMEEGKDINL